MTPALSDSNENDSRSRLFSRWAIFLIVFVLVVGSVAMWGEGDEHWPVLLLRNLAKVLF